MIDPLGAGGLPPAGAASFVDHLRRAAPELLPGGVPGALAPAPDPAPHGTTIVALTHASGVLIAGDRRATMGNLIASRDIDKVFVTDDASAVGIAGTAGIAVELARLFTVELEHYEKIEGVSLTLDGKANRLAGMVRANLGAALQGLAAVPLLVGYDTLIADPARAGRIVSFDVTGGRYGEHAGYHAVGSGSLFARAALKRLHRPDGDGGQALATAVEALYDAAEDDTATGGPDTARGIYPTAVDLTADGARVLGREEIAAACDRLIARRHAAGGRATGEADSPGTDTAQGQERDR